MAENHVRFDSLCRAKGKKRSELAREAVGWYLDNQEKLIADSRETLLEKRMRKMEERLAALMARTAIDVGTIFSLMYRNIDQNKSDKERDEMMAWAYNTAVKRLKKKLEGQAAEVREAIKTDRAEIS
jgi:hypothetical protein